jgi:hypothetical protein
MVALLRSMRNSPAASAVALAIALLTGEQVSLADPIPGIIDTSAIRDRHSNPGNFLGVSYNPFANVLYLSVSTNPTTSFFAGGYVYTLDLQGDFLHEFDFQAAYPAALVPESLSYDSLTGHLFVETAVAVGVDDIVEMSPDGATVFNAFTVPAGGGGGIVVRPDGIWKASFAAHEILHYTRDGALIDQISVADIFSGSFPGPYALASSFDDGLLILDFFGERLVETDLAGKRSWPCPRTRSIQADSCRSVPT